MWGERSKAPEEAKQNTFSRKAHRGDQSKGKQGNDYQGVELVGRRSREEGTGIGRKRLASGAAATAYSFISVDTRFTTIGSTVYLLGRFGFMYFTI